MLTFLVFLLNWDIFPGKFSGFFSREDLQVPDISSKATYFQRVNIINKGARRILKTLLIQTRIYAYTGVPGIVGHCFCGTPAIVGRFSMHGPLSLVKHLVLWDTCLT